MFGLWALAAVTTAVLNLDTTVVLLTPLYLRLARRTGVEPFPLVVIPLLLASFASSVLPVSNLTTLIVVQRFDLGTLDVLAHLALPSLAATMVGWWAYRRRFPTVLSARVDRASGSPRAHDRWRDRGGVARGVRARPGRRGRRMGGRPRRRSGARGW